MWKKDETPEPTAYPRPEPVLSPPRPAAPLEVAPSSSPGQRATIGTSITIRGDVTGDEDLLIQGRVEGSVDLKQHAVTIGREGQVKADVTGRVIAVDGRVEGNLKADEQVILRASAVVQGDIVAPRVVLEDGARFRGGVDMGDVSQAPAPLRSAAGKAAPAAPTGRPTPAAGSETRAETSPATPQSGASKPDTATHRATAEITP